jgi:hypothetical protein
MEELEKRSAFHTSLQYLAKAERIDGVHPSVRRARLRLLAGGTLRHLQQKKPNLAQEKLAQMEALPQAQQGDRPAFLAALRYLVCAVRGANAEAESHRAEVERLLGSKPAAALLICGLANAAKQRALGVLPPVELLGKRERSGLPEAVIRVVELTRDLQTTQPIPGSWLRETAAQFGRNSQLLNVGQLQTLAEVGLNAEHFELAYAVSASGLERGGPTEAIFMLSRARSLVGDPEGRWAVCAAAAAQLARQQRQMDIVDKAVEMLAGSPFDDLTLTPEQAATVVRKEKAAPAFPRAFRSGPDYSDLVGATLCDCPNCRRARGETGGPFEDFEDDDDDLDLDAILEQTPLPPGMPPELARIMLEQAAKAVQSGESLDSMLNRVIGPEPGPGRRHKKGRRR